MSGRVLEIDPTRLARDLARQTPGLSLGEAQLLVAQRMEAEQRAKTAPVPVVIERTPAQIAEGIARASHASTKIAQGVAASIAQKISPPPAVEDEARRIARAEHVSIGEAQRRLVIRRRANQSTPPPKGAALWDSSPDTS